MGAAPGGAGAGRAGRVSDALLVTVAEAMAITGVTRRTIYHWMTRGKVEWVHTAGVGRRIYADGLYRRGNADPPTFARPAYLDEPVEHPRSRTGGGRRVTTPG